MTQKKVPGADWVYMVYDDRDRLVLTQDGVQRENDQWTFTKYDALNRPVLTGIYADTSGITGMQAKVDQFYDAVDNAGNTDEWFEISDGPIHGYTNNSFPKVSTADAYLTITYYDNYDFAAALDTAKYKYDDEQLVASGSEPGKEASNISSVEGQVSGKKIKNLETNVWYWTLYYYDH